MKKNIVLVAYEFPPNAGIGARRWAKFAKGLATKGICVNVIKANPVFDTDDSPWRDDVLHRNIKIHSIPRCYPAVISNSQQSFWGIIQYKVAIFWLYLICKGSIYDRAKLWKSALWKELKLICETQRIDSIIVTGAPFSLFGYCIRFRDRYLSKKVKVIVDYRDPWLDSRFYGMTGLSKKRFSHEVVEQKFVVSNADCITAPYLSILHTVAEQSNVAFNSQKFKLLPHVYDEDDFNSDFVSNENMDSEEVGYLKFIFGGSLYSGIDYYVSIINDYLDYLKEKNSDKYTKTHFTFYTNDRERKHSFEKHKEKVSFLDPIGKKWFSEILKSDAIIVFLAEYNKNFLTTKIVECLALKKPILLLGPEGEASKYIEESGIGKRIESLEGFFSKLERNQETEVSKFSLEYQSTQLVKIVFPNK